LTLSVTASEKLNVVRDDLDLASGLSILFPPVLVELAFDGNLLALHEIGVQGFAGAAPEDYGEKTYLFNPHLPLISSLINCNIEFAYSHSS
jgi:hypothetical protein